MKRAITLILTLTLLMSLCMFSCTAYAEDEITVTDMIGREVTVAPGSYQRVVCIGAGALRMYSYIGDMSLLCGVEDIDNISLAERPRMFDSVARPYMLAYGEALTALPSCGVGGPQAQTAEAEKILSCNPDIVISEYEDVEKEDALQEQLGVPVITLKAGPGGVFDDNFFGTMRMLGQIFRNEEKAEKLCSFIESERAEISRRTADIPEEEKPAVYICGLGNWGTTNHLMTAQNYISFNVANVRNVVTDLEAPGIQAIEEEKFVALGEDMDIIIMDAAALFFMSGILIYTALYRKRGRLDDKLFFGMVLTNMALAASDATAYLLEGRAFTEAGKMIVACNVVFYAAFEIFPYLFLLFLDFRVRKEPEHVRKSSVLYCIPALVIVVLLLLNLRTGWLYSVSKNNIYHTGPYNDVVFLPVAVYSVLILAKLYRIDRRLTLLGIILILARVGFGVWFRSISSTAMTYTLFLVATHIVVMNRTIKEEVL